MEDVIKGRRFVYHIEGEWQKGHGHRVSIVIENEPGHFPTGGFGNKAPWYWGDPNDSEKSFELAEETAKKANLRLGHSEEDIHTIITSSMFPDRRAVCS